MIKDFPHKEVQKYLHFYIIFIQHNIVIRKKIFRVRTSLHNFRKNNSISWRIRLTEGRQRVRRDMGSQLRVNNLKSYA